MSCIINLLVPSSSGGEEPDSVGWPVESVTFFSLSGFLAQPDPDDPAKMFRFLTTDII